MREKSATTRRLGQRMILSRSGPCATIERPLWPQTGHSPMQSDRSCRWWTKIGCHVAGIPGLPRAPGRTSQFIIASTVVALSVEPLSPSNTGLTARLCKPRCVSR